MQQRVGGDCQGIGDGALEICPDCGVTLPRADGTAHPYFGASASCWALYGEILAKEYSDPRYMKVHRMTVDAYAAQHPGKPERRAIQSVHIHLAGLYLVVEKQAPAAFVRRVIAELTMEPDLCWLEPPDSLGPITIFDVVRARSPEAHETIVTQWARAVWAAWQAHHSIVVQRTEKVARRI